MTPLMPVSGAQTPPQTPLLSSQPMRDPDVHERETPLVLLRRTDAPDDASAIITSAPILHAEREKARDKALCITPPGRLSTPRADELAKGWASEAKTRRPLPKPARIALVGGGVLLLLVVGARQCGGPQRASEQSMALHQDLVVSEASLRKRKEVSPEDFRTPPRARRAVRVVAPSTPPPVQPPTALPPSSKKPSRRLAAKRPRSTLPPPAPPSDFEPIEVIHFEQPKASKKRAAHKGRYLARAGDRLSARLVTPVRLEGSGSATIVVRITTRGPLRGARLVGMAQGRGSRVTLRFRRAVLPNGREFRIEAEARDQDGLPGIAARIQGGGDDSMATDVGESSGSRIARSVAGGGIVGGLTGDVLRSRDRRRWRRSPKRFSAPAGRRLTILFSSGLSRK